MSGYKYTTSSVEKDRVMDILMTQKHLTDLYNTSSNEVDCNVIHNDLVNILKEEHEMQHQLYDAMKKRGWYDTKKADQSEVNNIYNEFNNMKKELGIKS
jgi:spore coat protein CotF